MPRPKKTRPDKLSREYTVRLTDDIADKLAARAAALGSKPAVLMREIIEASINQPENISRRS